MEGFIRQRFLHYCVSQAAILAHYIASALSQILALTNKKSFDSFQFEKKFENMFFQLSMSKVPLITQI